MDLFNINPEDIFSFLLTFFRISLVLFMLPFFGGKSLPLTVKASLCLVLSLGLWPSLSFEASYFPAHPADFALMIIGELLLGLVLSVVINFLFAAIQTGGQIIGFQMGFAMINVMDPITGVTEAITAHFMYMTSLLIFLSINGHLYLLSGLAQSFDLIPPGGLLITPMLVNRVLEFSAQIFILAVKIAAPVMATVILVDIALALVARAAPQMNVLFVGLPIRIMVGFIFLALLFKLMTVYITDFVINLDDMFLQVLRAGS
ncbi:MAG: flagellar biosynthetic protein FliR [Thermodesulfobacteriota bacterium]